MFDKCFIFIRITSCSSLASDEKKTTATSFYYQFIISIRSCVRLGATLRTTTKSGRIAGKGEEGE